MISQYRVTVVLAVIAVVFWCKELEATRQVVLTCGSDEKGEKGDTGPPGGQGWNGAPGKKCDPGIKGEQGICPIDCSSSAERISKIEMDLKDLSQCISSCRNGRCVRENNSSICSCNSGYTGRYCDEITCEDQPCGNHSHCTGPNQCTCDEGYFRVINGCAIVFSSCDNVSRSGLTTSGVYNVTVQSRPDSIPVYCELNADGENWLVIQRRINGSVDFYRNWTEYQHGFGQLNTEFWLGLDLIHLFNSLGYNQLRVDLEDWSGNTAYAIYSSFTIGDLESNYRLTLNGYHGTAGDAMSYNSQQPFSTKDQDNGGLACAYQRRSGWWHDYCTYANLNGKYFGGGKSNSHGIFWNAWKKQLSLKRVQMKIKSN